MFFLQIAHINDSTKFKSLSFYLALVPCYARGPTIQCTLSHSAACFKVRQTYLKIGDYYMVAFLSQSTHACKGTVLKLAQHINFLIKIKRNEILFLFLF